MPKRYFRIVKEAYGLVDFVRILLCERDSRFSMQKGN